MRHMRPLAIPTNTQLGLRTLALCHRDQLRHVLASGGGTAFVEAGDVGGVVVYALHGYLGGAELGD